MFNNVTVGKGKTTLFELMKQFYIFNSSENQNGKSSRQKAAEDLYVGAGIDYEGIIQEAYQLTMAQAAKDPPHFKGRSYMATRMNWNMQGLLQERYPHLIQFDEEKRIYVQLDEKTRMYFKKLDKKYRPQNIPTKHVRELNSAQGNLFGNTNVSILYAGFRLKKDGIWEDMDCFVVEMKSLKRAGWVTSLSELASRFVKPTTTKVITAVQPPSKATPGVRAKRKDTGQSGKTADGSI